MGGIGFGTGVYSYITQGHKTAGEVVTHNGLTLGTVATVIVGLTIEALGLNSGVWASYGTDYLYKNNIFGLKNGTDWGVKMY